MKRRCIVAIVGGGGQVRLMLFATAEQSKSNEKASDELSLCQPFHLRNKIHMSLTNLGSMCC